MAPPRKKTDRKKLLAAARIGGAAAQLALAKSYEREAPVDLRQAKHWYLKAATQGLAEAQSLLGDMLADAGDIKGALRWYQAAATQGESFAQNNLAVRLRDDFGQRRAAIPWFRAAAEQGHSDAQVSLGYASLGGHFPVPSAVGKPPHSPPPRVPRAVVACRAPRSARGVDATASSCSARSRALCGG